MIKIMPDEAVLNQWIQDFKFDYDVFYLAEEDTELFTDYLKDATILTKKQFFKHALANDIKYINYYEFWLMDAQTTHIMITKPGCFESLPAELKFRLMALQLEMGRGFICRKEILSHPISDEYTLKNKTILTSRLVDHLSHHDKEKIQLSGVEGEQDNIVIETKRNTSAHIKAVANSFSAVNGSNCFGATLFAITEDEEYLTEWVHQHSFLAVLQENGYELTHGENKIGDVMVWEDDNGILRHACYYLGNGLYFNKSGQKIYNPWKIVSWRELSDDWDHYNYLIYRK